MALSERQKEILSNVGVDVTIAETPDVSMTEGVVRSALQGVTFGFADEIEAGIRQFLPEVLGGGEYGELVSEIRGGLEEFRSDNPGVAITSEVVGSVVPAVIGGLLTGGAATGPAIARAASSVTPGFVKEATKKIASTNVGKQAALGAAGGAIYGAGVSEGGIAERLPGAAIGAATGAGVGGTLGAVFPKIKEGAKELVERGIPLTPGQAFGGVPRAIEEAATVLPFAGEAVGAAQKRAVQKYSGVVIEDVLSPLGVKMPKGVVGSEAIGFAQKKIGEEYGKIIPVLTIENPSPVFERLKLSVNPENIAEKADVVLSDAAEKNLKTTMNTIFKILGGENVDEIAGQRVRKVEKILGKKASNLMKGDADQQDLGRVLFDVQTTLRDELLKQNTGKGADKLKVIHTAYKELLPAQKASLKSVKEKGEFGPAELVSAIAQKDKTKAAAGRAPMQEQVLDALEILGTPRGGIARPILEARQLMDLGNVARYAGGIGAAGAAPIATAATLGGVGAAYTPLGVPLVRGGLGLLSESPRIAPIAASIPAGLLDSNED